MLPCVITPASIQAAVVMAAAARSPTPYRIAAKTIFSTVNMFLSDISEWVCFKANSQHDPTPQSSSVELSSNSTFSVDVDGSSRNGVFSRSIALCFLWVLNFCVFTYLVVQFENKLTIQFSVFGNKCITDHFLEFSSLSDRSSLCEHFLYNLKNRDFQSIIGSHIFSLKYQRVC